MSVEAPGPPPRLSRSEAKARTRARLLEGAATVFARKGYGGASVDDIAAAAGFTTGALYSNFAGKDEVFVELLTSRSSTQMAKAIAIVADVDTPIEERRSTLAHHLVEVAEKDPHLAVLEAEFWLYAVRHPDVQALMAAQLHINRDALTEQLVAWATSRGHADTIPFDDLSTTLLALFRGLVQLRRTDADLVPDELYANAVRWLFAGITTIYDDPVPEDPTRGA